MTLSTLGIDISKLKFDVALLRDNGKFKHRVFPNTTAGFLQLSAWLEKQKVERVHACLEATTIYSEAVATYLSDAGHVVSVINPAAIKAYGQSRLSRTKTDKADATLIAQFCQERRPPQWQPLPVEIRELQALVRRLIRFVRPVNSGVMSALHIHTRLNPAAPLLRNAKVDEIIEWLVESGCQLDQTMTKGRGIDGQLSRGG